MTDCEHHQKTRDSCNGCRWMDYDRGMGECTRPKSKSNPISTIASLLGTKRKKSKR